MSKNQESIDNSNSPITAEEIESISQFAKIIEVCVNGQLNSDAKQKIRDAHAYMRDENPNQPEWTNTNYLEMIIENVFSLGCLIGKERERRLSQKEFYEAMEKMREHHHQAMREMVKDSIKIAFEGEKQ
tara:strand:- start:255 stop:641 length:387 start_codon:yes stop_codon:yes gene_type:complete